MSQHLNETTTSQRVPIATPFGGRSKQSKGVPQMALLALSHTSIEHNLYVVMCQEVSLSGDRQGLFGARRLMELTGLRSYSSIRRGIAGLLAKHSIKLVDGEPLRKSVYQVFEPAEIFARRHRAGQAPYPEALQDFANSKLFPLIVKTVLKRQDLSRREAVVTLFCAEGQSNAEIGRRLSIDEKTVKYHLRHIYSKFGLKRRTELVSFLLRPAEWSRR